MLGGVCASYICGELIIPLILTRDVLWRINMQSGEKGVLLHPSDVVQWIVQLPQNENTSLFFNNNQISCEHYLAFSFLYPTGVLFVFPVACRGDDYLVYSFVPALNVSRNSKYSLPKLGSYFLFRHAIRAVHLRGGLVYPRLRHFLRHQL